TSVTFPATIVDDAQLDGSQTVTVTASASGYSSGNTTMIVDDNETAALSLNVPATATEGDGTVQASVGVSAPPASDVAVALLSSDTTAAIVPASVTIPAGQTSAAFSVTIVDDTKIDGAQTATLTAHVANWSDGAATISVADNESHTLALAVPASASE